MQPLIQLKLITISWILEEATHNKLLDDTFIDTVNKSLHYDFKETLKIVVKARIQHNIALGSCAMIVLAVLYPIRARFNEDNPLFFRNCIKKVMKDPIDAWNIFIMWQKYTNNKESKKGFPTILKKCIAQYLEKISEYQMKKYLVQAHVIDLIRLTHPRSRKNNAIEQIIKTGKLNIKDTCQTWKKLRSCGCNWKEIIYIFKYFPHLALLENLVSICEEINKETDEKLFTKLHDLLVGGIKYEIQMPHKYISIHKILTNIKTKPIIINAIMKCLDESLNNLPLLTGNTLCLSNNANSAIQTIGNQSSVITANRCTGKGVVGIYGDNIELYTIDKNKAILEQIEDIQSISKTIKNSIENDINKLFNTICTSTIEYWYDNIFIYSKQQIIDSSQLFERYRKKVNPDVNIYCICNNPIDPNNTYRTHTLNDWTGKEIIYAKEMNRIVDTYTN